MYGSSYLFLPYQNSIRDSQIGLSIHFDSLNFKTFSNIFVKVDKYWVKVANDQ